MLCAGTVVVEDLNQSCLQSGPDETVTVTRKWCSLMPLLAEGTYSQRYKSFMSCVVLEVTMCPEEVYIGHHLTRLARQEVGRNALLTRYLAYVIGCNARAD